MSGQPRRALHGPGGARQGGIAVSPRAGYRREGAGTGASRRGQAPGRPRPAPPRAGGARGGAAAAGARRRDPGSAAARGAGAAIGATQASADHDAGHRDRERGLVSRRRDARERAGARARADHGAAPQGPDPRFARRDPGHAARPPHAHAARPARPARRGARRAVEVTVLGARSAPRGRDRRQPGTGRSARGRAGRREPGVPRAVGADHDREGASGAAPRRDAGGVRSLPALRSRHRAAARSTRSLRRLPGDATGSASLGRARRRRARGAARCSDDRCRGGPASPRRARGRTHPRPAIRRLACHPGSRRQAQPRSVRGARRLAGALRGRAAPVQLRDQRPRSAAARRAARAEISRRDRGEPGLRSGAFAGGAGHGFVRSARRRGGRARRATAVLLHRAGDRCGGHQAGARRAARTGDPPRRHARVLHA